MSSDPQLLNLISLVVCLVCMNVGLAGYLIPYPRPRAPEQTRLQTQAQIVQVEPPKPRPAPTPLPQPVPVQSQLPAPTVPTPPVPTPVAAAPPIIPVAPPSSAVSFAVPVQGLTRIVDINDAARFIPQSAPSVAPSTTRPPPPKPPPPAPSSTSPPPVITRLTLGSGEGRQPPPDYPREAALAHQQGTVTLRFTVNSAGTVVSVHMLSPSPYPLLNQAASRAIRETWHFSADPGTPTRLYEVPVQFTLSK